MEPLEQQVRRTVERLQLFRPGEHVVVAVSGGPDSLALLHVLHALRSHLKIRLSVATLDHMLRPDSASEAAFVGRQAQALGLFCVQEQRDVLAYAREHRLSVEEAAREVRYRFLAEVAAAVGATAVATGHTADDQAETVLMHFLRGAGLSGLKGMLPRAPADVTERTGAVPARPDVVRPLLFTPRAEVLAYLEQRGLVPCLDPSNSDTTFFRNRLRHELLPLLEAHYQPNVRRLLVRTAETLAVDWDYLRSQVEQAWHTLAQPEDEHVCFPRQAFLSQHQAVQRGLVRKAVRRLRPMLRDVGWEHVVEALRVARTGEAGTRATLPGHLFLFVERQALVIGPRPLLPPWPRLPAGTRVPVAVPGETEIGEGWVLTVQLTAPEEVLSNVLVAPDPWQAFLDADHVRLPLALRTRRAGDRFTPLGMAVPVKLADFLTAQKVPLSLRDEMALLVDANDHILWVLGLRPAHGTRLTEATHRVLALSCYRRKDG
ncbi:MAG: tRNA lysidine(34) synthetase TilS [Ardenticatenia bacterium]|nr:tRNA lysidine(34) synthetase TilS [Ardenticatenia bacterium]